MESAILVFKCVARWFVKILFSIGISLGHQFLLWWWCMLMILQFNFRGIVSSCFEPHLRVYIELEEKTLMESLEKLVQLAGVHYLLLLTHLYFLLIDWCSINVLPYVLPLHACRKKLGILRRSVRIMYYLAACKYVAKMSLLIAWLSRVQD